MHRVRAVHPSRPVRAVALALAVPLAVLASCGDGDNRATQVGTAESCMRCHNGSQHDDYAGPGLENPHPFGTAANLACTTCHGGNPDGIDAATSHVPPPPEIGDRERQRTNRFAFFNRLTLTGLDKLPDYEVDGRSYTALDYLQFVNPGDLRITEAGRSCGQCHAPHSNLTAQGVLATETGILSGAAFAAGVDNSIPEHRGLFEDTASDYGFRAVAAEDFTPSAQAFGVIQGLNEYPVYSRREESPDSLFRNDDFDAAALSADLTPDNRIESDSHLAKLYHEQVAFTCGDCHLGSAGANNRAGDFRSSGCTACHMQYSLGGRSLSLDPNVPKDEPRDPDDIDPGERAHVRSHRIASVHKTLPSGAQIQGIDDYACAGCHQGSNRTVMQYWGIRLDQNQDLRREVQYPANPVAWRSTRNDERLFDPEVGNRTFNGRNHNQYIVFEDYDGDGRDDTPEDVHYEAGLGCIDCHGSHDLHGGDIDDPDSEGIASRMEQATAIACENCHGGVDGYAAVAQGTALDGTEKTLAVDRHGKVLDHVERDAEGHYWLTSKLTGRRHYVPQTYDSIVDNGRIDPRDNQPIYSFKASYAMGRDDGDPNTGVGPQQNGSPHDVCHSDSMSCASCHSAWTNTCAGCHLIGEYDEGNNFSNITGERIAFREKNAEFVYQSPVPFSLGYNARGEITQTSTNTKVFFRYEDRQNDLSQVFAFSDRNGKGNDPAIHGALGHNALMAHSIRGKVTAENEGPRYCVACHLTDQGLATHRADYDAFRTALQANDYGSLDFPLLQQHIGRNPGNTLDSPIWVHMVAGLGSGLFLFDENGGPVNPLDQDVNRFGTDGQAPAAIFDPNRVRYDLDRIVGLDGVSRASSNHAFLDALQGPGLRDGADDPNMAGPLGATLVDRLTNPDTGIVLDSWIDADGVLRGGLAPTSRER